MAVYLDFPRCRAYGKLMRGMRPSAHLMADTKEELHEFANQYGVKRCWYDGNRRHPHYDLRNGDLERVLEVLVPISSKEMVKIWKKSQKSSKNSSS